jgi:hypothetical protein
VQLRVDPRVRGGDRLLRGTPIDPDTFAGGQICEGAAPAVISERREREERQAQQSKQARSARGQVHAW